MRHVVGHAIQTLLGIASLWILPWVVVLGLAALLARLEKQFRNERSVPLHFPKAGVR